MTKRNFEPIKELPEIAFRRTIQARVENQSCSTARTAANHYVLKTVGIWLPMYKTESNPGVDAARKAQKAVEDLLVDIGMIRC
jgi:ribosomal protein L16/L10AE